MKSIDFICITAVKFLYKVGLINSVATVVCYFLFTGLEINCTAKKKVQNDLNNRI